jgi:hypothetical protein
MLYGQKNLNPWLLALRISIRKDKCGVRSNTYVESLFEFSTADHNRMSWNGQKTALNFLALRMDCKNFQSL